MTWAQDYVPLGNIWLSSLVAAIPILFFFLALTLWRLKGYQAATVTVLLTLVIAYPGGYDIETLPLWVVLAAAGAV